MVRIYGSTLPNSSSLTDDEFMDLAEELGFVWTLFGFQSQFNNNELPSSLTIRML